MENNKNPAERANEIYHWGIKGQKWGFRRFQNKDGSLTNAGRIRYGDDDDEGNSTSNSKKRNPNLSKRKGDNTVSDKRAEALARNALTETNNSNNSGTRATDTQIDDPSSNVFDKTTAKAGGKANSKVSDSNLSNRNADTTVSNKQLDARARSEFGLANTFDDEAGPSTKFGKTAKPTTKSDEPNKSEVTDTPASKETKGSKNASTDGDDSPKPGTKNTPAESSASKKASNDQSDNTQSTVDKTKQFTAEINQLKSANKALDSAASIARTLKQESDNAIRNAPKVKLDLTNMSDAELRSKINRAQLEQQYNDMFAPSTVTKGQVSFNEMLSKVTTALTVAGGAVSLAIGIKQLLNK